MPPGSPTAVGSHDGPRGLIAVSIENHDDFVLICECLEKKGYQVIRVTPAPDLPTALTIDLPDLVILDHIEALKHLREFEAFLGVSVIFFTPWLYELIVDAYQAGADICLPLPFDPKDFFNF